ncbi:MAG: hypothetical protein FWG37_02480 [Clostridia bacterium]|nr:hypothetical protein [Clostridia bacterium]
MPKKGERFPLASSQLWPPLAGVLLSVGVILPVLRSISMDTYLSAVLGSVAAGALCLLWAVWGKGRKLFWFGGVALVLFILLITGFSARLGGMLDAGINLFRGNTAPMKSYAPEAALLAGFVFSALGFSLAKQSAGFYPALSLTMISVLFVWFSGVRDGLWFFMPAVVVLLALYAHTTADRTPQPKTLIVASLIVSAALLLTPSLRFTSARLERFAETLRNYITDTFFFTEPRTVYSIQADGYKPLETRLGGPAEIRERPVMTVQAPRSMLLRGAIYNEYNGLSWGDTLSARRYLFADFRNRNIRANTLDEKRPAGNARDPGTFELLPVQITMQSDSASTLFVPLRTEQLTTPLELVPYFNTSSELFVTRNLMATDTYSLMAPVVALDDPRLPGQLATAALANEHRDMSDYLRVPEAVAREVYDLALRVTRDASTDFEKALALREHLRRNYAYTLSPEVPPHNQDFVSYFLLCEKQGYCTYFASAMAVMGRIVGLPTRYVEGYLAEPSAGTAHVTSRNAHAWTEVYFDGFGWISFDATPPRNTGGPRTDNGGPTPDEQSLPPSPPPDDLPDDGQTGSPEDEPTPSPSPDDSDATLPQDNPNQQQNTDDGPQPPEENIASNPDDNGHAWLWLFPLALICGVLAREYFTRPGTVSARNAKDDGERLMAWYRALLGILSASGFTPQKQDSPGAVAYRALDRFPDTRSGLLALAHTITRYGYGRAEATPAMVEEARSCYRAVFGSAPFPAKTVWTARRTVFGLGSLKKVP